MERAKAKFSPLSAIEYLSSQNGFNSSTSVNLVFGVIFAPDISNMPLRLPFARISNWPKTLNETDTPEADSVIFMKLSTGVSFIETRTFS